MIRTTFALAALTGLAPAQDTWRVAAGSGSAFPIGAIAFDRARGELLRRTADGETWVHDGDRWAKRALEVAYTSGLTLLADDPARQRVVMQNMANGQTAEWDGSQWLLRTTNPSLISDRATIAYDPVRQRMVLSHWVPSSSSYWTWEWDGSTWTRPDTQFWATPDAMAFDGRRGRVIGLIYGTNLYEWTGTTWQLVQNGLLPPRTGASWSMAFDSRRQRLVILQSNATRVEVFEWDGSQLFTPTPSVAPVGRTGLRTTWDPIRQRVVGHGGEAWPNQLSDTWEWDGTTWTERDQAPLAGKPMAMVYDGSRARTVLYGVIGTTLLPSTWEWDGHRWQHLASAAPLPVTVVGPLVHDAARARTMLLAADGPIVAAWSFDGSNWTPQPANSAPPARTGFAVAYDSTRQEVVMFGGATSVPIAETWRFDGSTWTQALPATSPTGRTDHAMAYDPGRQRTILFGGASADTWEWDGMTWTRRFPATAIAARFGQTMTFDPGRGAVVLTGGGYIAGPPLRTWARPAELFEWNGADWQRRTTAGLPAQLFGQLVHDGHGLLLHTGQRERQPQPLSDLVIASTTYQLVNAPAASVTPHGAGCAGALGVPRLDAWHVPYVGNPDFAVRVTSVVEGTPVVFAYGGGTANIPLAGGCTQLVAPIFASDFAAAASGGEARVALAVPAVPALLGYALAVQAAVLDGVGAFDGISVSAALRLLLAN